MNNRIQELKPLIAARKPKESKKLVNELLKEIWPENYESIKNELCEDISRYKYNHARLLIEEVESEM